MWKKKKEQNENTAAILKKKIHVMKRNKVVTSLAFIAMGVILLLWPGETLSVAAQVIGACLTLAGAAAVVMYFVGDEKSFFSISAMVIGVIVGVLGLFILINPVFLVALIPTIMGFIILISGIINISEAMTIHRQQGDGAVMSLVIGMITIILGVIILINPFHTASLMCRFLGIFLIFDGVSDLVIISRITSEVREASQVLHAVDSTAKDVTGEDDSAQETVDSTAREETAADAQDTVDGPAQEESSADAQDTMGSDGQ